MVAKRRYWESKGLQGSSPHGWMHPSPPAHPAICVGRPGVKLLGVVGRWGGNSEELQLCRSCTRNLLKSKCFSNFRKMQGRQVAAHILLFQNYKIGRSTPKTCRGMLWGDAVPHTSCQMGGSFHVQLISSGYATYGKTILKESAKGQRGRQGKGRSWCSDGIITSFKNTYN